MPPLHRGLITLLRSRESSAASCIMDSLCRRPSAQAAACVHLSLIQQMAGLAGNMCPRALVHRKPECHLRPAFNASRRGISINASALFQKASTALMAAAFSPPSLSRSGRCGVEQRERGAGGWVGREGGGDGREGLRLKEAPLVSRASPRCSSGRQGLFEFRIKSLSQKVANFVLPVTYRRCTRRKRGAPGWARGDPLAKVSNTAVQIALFDFSMYHTTR